MAKLYIGLGVTVHWGEPKNDMRLVGASPYRFKAGTTQWMEHQYVNRVDHWYGLTCGSRWALLFMRTTRMANGVVPSPDQGSTHG